MKKSYLLLLLFIAVSCKTSKQDAEPEKPRLLVTTDIGGDPDDQQSLVRLLVHSNEFDIEGIIASASGTPGELDTAIVKPYLIHEQIDAYEKVYHNLLLHSAEFVHPDSLRTIVKSGNPYRGTEYIGNDHDTEGSEWILSQIIKTDKRKLNICIWGGQTDVIQALWKLKQSVTPDKFASYIANFRIYDINDQDYIDGFIRKEFPDIFYILAKAPLGTDKREGAYRGMYLGGDMDITSREWIYTNIKENHGPLGALYPDKTWTAPNPHGVMKEGDTPSWFYFLNNGLQDPDHPDYGGWGGRFVIDSAKYYKDANDKIDTVQSARATVWRWREAFQNDFAARMDWCVMPFDNANHAPIAIINNSTSNEFLILPAEKNETIKLDATASYDPDNDQLTYKWWVYSDVTGIETIPTITSDNEPVTNIKIPDTQNKKDIHVILEVTDNGDPALTSYRRVVIGIE